MDQKAWAAMLAVKRSAGVIPWVNMINSLHASDAVHKTGIYPGFEIQDRCHQRFKAGVSVDLQPFFKKFS